MHHLALTLHKTVGELMDSMTMADYQAWNLFFSEQEREREAERVRREIAANRAAGVYDARDPDGASMLIAQVHQFK